MQLGTRWALGSKHPTTLPAVVGSAVHDVEAELRADDVDTAGWSWTLTWLEGRPVVELDDGTLITYDDRHDTATVRQNDDDADDDDY